MATPTKVLAPSPGTGNKGQCVKIYPASEDSVVYTQGRAVIIRNLSDPAKTVTYFGHVQPTTVASVSPSGYYCASADSSGAVRVWDLVSSELITKLETRPFAGTINDLTWDGESKRLIAVGDGKELSARGFTSDSGNSTGDISGHSKAINAVAIRHQRPFRAVTAGDDHQLVFHTGVPWKFNKVIRTHSGFVQAVTYSPDGNYFASAGSDRKIFLYDGKEGDVLTAEGLAGHQGTVYAVSFTKAGDQLVTASADGTVKLWSVPEGKEVASWTALDGQQLVGGCVLGNGKYVVVGLTGELAVIDLADTSSGKASQVFYGHQKGVTGFAGTKDTLFTGSFDGTLNTFDVSSGTCTPVQGSSSHSGGPIVAMTSAGPSTVLSAAMDGMVKEMDASAKSFKPSSAAATGLPKSIAADANGKSYIVTEKSVEVVSSGAKSSSIPLDFTPSSGAAYSTTKALLAVGGEDGKVRIYANGSLTKTLESNRSAVSALSFSPDGAYLAAGESNGKIVLFNTGDWSVKTTQWAFHSARITCLAWSEDSQFCASGSLDTALYVWSVARPVKKVAIKNAHYGGVTGVCWTGADVIASTGSDATVRMYKIALPA